MQRCLMTDEIEIYVWIDVITNYYKYNTFTFTFTNGYRLFSLTVGMASKGRDGFSYGLRPRPSSSKLIVYLITASIFATFLLFQLPPQLSGNPAYLIQVHNGAVASENKRCSDIGVDVLKDGGNAVDAAIAATLCLGVVNMFSSVPEITNGSRF